MDNQIVVSDYAQMDRVLREERAYILNLVKQIKKAGCNVLLIQKSILRYTRTVTIEQMLVFMSGQILNVFHTNNKLSSDRDALSDLALHFLNKMKIMVVKEIEREDIEFICKVSQGLFSFIIFFYNLKRDLENKGICFT